MYVDIGMDLAVRASQVLGVFDLDNTSWSKRTREFLQRAQEDGSLIEATDELPKSFVLTQEYGQTRVYLTKYNASILRAVLPEINSYITPSSSEKTF